MFDILATTSDIGYQLLSYVTTRCLSKHLYKSHNYYLIKLLNNLYHTNNIFMNTLYFGLLRQLKSAVIWNLLLKFKVILLSFRYPFPQYISKVSARSTIIYPLVITDQIQCIREEYNQYQIYEINNLNVHTNPAFNRHVVITQIYLVHIFQMIWN